MNAPPSLGRSYLWPIEDKIRLARRAKEAVDSVLGDMSDHELETLANVSPDDWTPEYREKWALRLAAADELVRRAVEAGVSMDVFN